MKHSLTTADVRKLYDKEVEKHERDGRVHATDLRTAMIRATRTTVFAALHLELPTEAPRKDEDPDDTHMRQKAHGKSLWKETDRLVTELEKTL